MNKLLILMAGIALAGTAAADSAPASGATAPRTYHYWLHPKLGMVKVDSVTHAMIVPGRQQRATTAPSR